MSINESETPVRDVTDSSALSWIATRWNCKAANVVMASRVYGPYEGRDQARQALLREISAEIGAWRRSSYRLKRDMLPKLTRIRTLLRDNPSLDRVTVDGLKYAVVSPAQQSCEHTRGFPLCTCLSDE